MSTLESIRDLELRMGRSIVGQRDVIRNLVIGLLANGNLLMEGLPGLAKTRAVKAMATNMDAGFSRIQFTPDLLPSDGTGTEVYYQKDGKGEFRFQSAPIFANTVLGDELDYANYRVANAPVSYPHLWDIWKFDWVQWNGSAAQPMGRNVGEALGVKAWVHLVDRDGVLLTPEVQLGSTRLTDVRTYLVYCSLGLVSLGDDVLLGNNVDIPSGQARHHFERLDVPIRSQGGTKNRVRIGRDVWIGNSALVLANVDDQAVVGGIARGGRRVPCLGVEQGHPAAAVLQHHHQQRVGDGRLAGTLQAGNEDVVVVLANLVDLA